MTRSILIFIIGLSMGCCITFALACVYLRMYGFSTIYASGFNDTVFRNGVHCGLSHDNVKSILGEPINKFYEKCEHQQSCESWVYSKQGGATNNYLSYRIVFRDGVVWNKETDVVLD